MKKIRYVLAIVLIAITALLVVACNGAQFNIVFDVDGEVYYTVSTAGEEEVAMPPNPEKENYVFDGWYWDKDIWQIPFTVGSLLDVKLESDLTVYAKWIERDITEKIFDVTFNTMGGTAVEAQKVQYGHLVSKPSDPAKEGQLFAGWYKDPDYKTSWNFAGDVIKENVTVYAKWVADIPENRKYTIAFNSNGGSAVEAYTDLAYNSLITSPDKPTKQGYVFVGWYFDNTYAKEWNWTLDKVTESLTLYAKWSATADTTTTDQTAYTREGSVIYFGTYPQSEVTDSTLKSTLTNKAGTLPTSSNSRSWTSYGYYISGSVSNYMWYIDVENAGEKYRGVYFTSYLPYYTGSSSSTGNTYQDDNGYYTSTVYWFKYEPIKWQILTESNGKAFLLCDIAIDSHEYHPSSNNYANSTIRAWLNDTFYNTAFNDLQKALIQTTTVDNSVSSTGYSSNSYACANTSDKVFLLSYVEATTYMTSYSARIRQSTDYAKSQGCWASTSSGFEGNCWWWLRSPFYYNSSYARYVRSDGSVGHYNYVYYTYYGVVPALWIAL